MMKIENKIDQAEYKMIAEMIVLDHVIVLTNMRMLMGIKIVIVIVIEEIIEIVLTKMFVLITKENIMKKMKNIRNQLEVKLICIKKK